MGFVFQSADLVAELTLLENVALPLELAGTPPVQARRAAAERLDRLGIDAQTAGRTSGSVSGGQAQRAAVARALVHRPRVVFADEPTGALDSANGRVVLDALLAARDEGTSVVLVTHDRELAASADRQIVLRDGRVLA
jgi:putative ABC transport system ATP-binding protein